MRKTVIELMDIFNRSKTGISEFPGAVSLILLVSPDSLPPFDAWTGKNPEKQREPPAGTQFLFSAGRPKTRFHPPGNC